MKTRNLDLFQGRVALRQATNRPIIDSPILAPVHTHVRMFVRSSIVDGSEQPDSGIIGVVVCLLEDESPKVRARALGTVHNLSTDARSIGIIREEVRS